MFALFALICERASLRRRGVCVTGCVDLDLLLTRRSAGIYIVQAAKSCSKGMLALFSSYGIVCKQWKVLE